MQTKSVFINTKITCEKTGSCYISEHPLLDLFSIINSLTPLRGPPQLPPSSFLLILLLPLFLSRTHKHVAMTRKVSNFSDLIQRVTTSCFLHSFADDREEEYHSDSFGNKPQDEQGYYGEEKMVMGLKVISREEKKLKQMRALMEEVFEAVSAMKSAYVSLQEAHCTWDPQSLREADVAVVAQLKKLALLRDGFHGSVSTVEEDEGRRRRGGNAPYETVMKKEVKAKDLHKVKLGCVATLTSHENKARRPHPYTKRKLGCNSQMQGKT